MSDWQFLVYLVGLITLAIVSGAVGALIVVALVSLL